MLFCYLNLTVRFEDCWWGFQRNMLCRFDAEAKVSTAHIPLGWMIVQKSSFQEGLWRTEAQQRPSLIQLQTFSSCMQHLVANISLHMQKLINFLYPWPESFLLTRKYTESDGHRFWSTNIINIYSIVVYIIHTI